MNQFLNNGRYFPQWMTTLQESDEETPENVTFAPKDVNPVKIGAKDNVHGIGYRGLDPRKALPATHVSLFPAPAITKTGKKGIRGTVCIRAEEFCAELVLLKFECSQKLCYRNTEIWKAPKSICFA